MNGWFFKSSPNLSQNWLKFKKILEKLGDLAQNLAKNWTNWYMNGSLFFEKLVFLHGSTFKFRGSTSLPKPNLSTPRGFSLLIGGENLKYYYLLSFVTEKLDDIVFKKMMLTFHPIYDNKWVAYYSMKHWIPNAFSWVPILFRILKQGRLKSVNIWCVFSQSSLQCRFKIIFIYLNRVCCCCNIMEVAQMCSCHTAAGTKF